MKFGSGCSFIYLIIYKEFDEFRKRERG